MSPTTLTICICTSGRPVELERCLASVAAGTRLPEAVFVSDDSPDVNGQQTVAKVVARYPFARYLSGPRRGLCANRNRVIDAVETTHLSLLDDDAVVGGKFVENALALCVADPGAIFSGDVIEGGQVLTPPSNQTFLGHFGRLPRAGESLANLHLNCNVLPTAAARDARFAESIVYGYEDCDFCAQLVALGWRFEHRPELVNTHLPPPRPGGDARHWQAERARFKVRVRDLGHWRPAPARLLCFALIAPFHFAASSLRAGRIGGVLSGWCWVVEDLVETARLRREAPRDMGRMK